MDRRVFSMAESRLRCFLFFPAFPRLDQVRIRSPQIVVTSRVVNVLTDAVLEGLSYGGSVFSSRVLRPSSNWRSASSSTLGNLSCALSTPGIPPRAGATGKPSDPRRGAGSTPARTSSPAPAMPAARFPCSCAAKELLRAAAPQAFGKTSQRLLVARGCKVAKSETPTSQHYGGPT